jgi:hypothetical protein
MRANLGTADRVALPRPHCQVFVTSEYICIAMEFASGGSLFTYVQRAVRLKEAAARWFFQQLIIGWVQQAEGQDGVTIRWLNCCPTG